MAKSFQLLFDPEEEKIIEEICKDEGISSGRQWLYGLARKEIKARQAVQNAFFQEEYVFQLKDGRYLREKGKTPGLAWNSLGYQLSQVEGMVLGYKTLAEAKAAGWPVNGVQASEAPKENGSDAALPFGS